MLSEWFLLAKSAFRRRGTNFAEKAFYVMMQQLGITSSPSKLERTDRPPIDDELIQEIAHKIVDAFHPRRIILFGSRARGDYNADSDVDIFVEMESDEPRWKRRRAIDDLFPRRWMSMHFYVVTPEEFRIWGSSLATILPTIQEEGKLLYERS